MEKLEYSVRSLTPIVTGDSKHINKELLGTGLKGCLRYQYWLMKAMEQWPQNKTAYKMPYKGEGDGEDMGSNLKKALQKAGPVIQLFGTTGWRPVFDMELDNCKPSIDPMKCSARSGEKSPFQWQFTLRFRRNRETKVLELGNAPLMKPEDEIQKLMNFVHHYGWLGSAPQNGLGWVQIDPPLSETTALKKNPFFSALDLNLSEDEVKNLINALTTYYLNKRRNENRDISCRRYATSLSILNTPLTAAEGAVIPIGYEIRRYLKDQCKSLNYNRFGDRGNASQVHVSHLVYLNGSWSVRLRFCSRPGIIATNKDEPGSCLDWCWNIIKKQPNQQ